MAMRTSAERQPPRSHDADHQASRHAEGLRGDVEGVEDSITGGRSGDSERPRDGSRDRHHQPLLLDPEGDGNRRRVDRGQHREERPHPPTGPSWPAAASRPDSTCC